MNELLPFDQIKEVQIAVEKNAPLSDLQLCDKIAERSNRNDFKGTVEAKEALMMRLTAMSPKKLNKLEEYAKKKLFQGNKGYIAVLNVFKIKTLCNM